MTPANSPEYMRAWRARHPGGPNGRPPTEPCGSLAAYRRHLRNEGAPVTCAECLAANAAHSDKYRTIAKEIDTAISETQWTACEEYGHRFELTGETSDACVDCGERREP